MVKGLSQYYNGYGGGFSSPGDSPSKYEGNPYKSSDPEPFSFWI